MDERPVLMCDVVDNSTPIAESATDDRGDLNGEVENDPGGSGRYQHRGRKDHAACRATSLSLKRARFTL